MEGSEARALPFMYTSSTARYEHTTLVAMYVSGMHTYKIRHLQPFLSLTLMNTKAVVGNIARPDVANIANIFSKIPYGGKLWQWENLANSL